MSQLNTKKFYQLEEKTQIDDASNFYLIGVESQSNYRVSSSNFLPNNVIKNVLSASDLTITDIKKNTDYLFVIKNGITELDLSVVIPSSTDDIMITFTLSLDENVQEEVTVKNLDEVLGKLNQSQKTLSGKIIKKDSIVYISTFNNALGGDITSEGDNTFTGSNVFSGDVNFNGNVGGNVYSATTIDSKLNEKTNNSDFNSHASDNVKHLSNLEHQNLTRLIAQFPQVTPDIPVVPGTMPDTALDYSVITSYISMQAQPGVSTAPGNIFGARVPWARQENGVWVNNDSNVNYSVFGAAQKLWDNLGLQNEPSTDKIEGVDDYIGKKWVFFWNRCNYISDNYGNKWVTAIEGYDTTAYGGTTFSTDKNVGVMGPKFWYCVKTEKYQEPETGNWLTVDGTEDGTPLYQLWIIGDRSWSELPTDRQEELTKHGITEDDWYLWPGCKVYDAADTTLKERPYYVHAAYAGGYEVSSLGTEGIVSKPNKPLRNNLSHNSLANLYGTTVLGGAECYVNTFGMLFDIVKNADKNSQTRYTGNASNQPATVLSTYSTKQADYVFPISSTGSFKVGCTVYICDTYYGNISNIPNSYIKTAGLQYGRILAIENRNIVTSDGESVSSLCLVFDPNTIDPFIVCTGSSNSEAQSAAQAISGTGQNACAFATQGFSLSGETDTIIGKHDGSLNLTDNAHAIRVQGTEYQPGTWILAADTIACKGDGATVVNINGTEHTPDSTQYVYLICPKGLTGRAQSGNLSSIIEDGYKPVAIGSSVSGGYILNMEVDGETGLAYPVSFGGTGSGSNYGHGDNFYVGGNPAEFLVGGSLSFGTSGGFAAVLAFLGLSPSSWLYGARD